MQSGWAYDAEPPAPLRPATQDAQNSAGCGWVALFPSLNWLSIRHHLIEHCVHWTEFCKWTRYLKYSYSNSYIDPTEANPIGKKYGA